MFVCLCVVRETREVTHPSLHIYAGYPSVRTFKATAEVGKAVEQPLYILGREQLPEVVAMAKKAEAEAGEDPSDSE